MSNLYDLIQRAKLHDQEALKELIRLFEPKIKQTSQFIPSSEREDLEQELKIQMLKAIDRFETENTPGFWKFLDHLK